MRDRPESKPRDGQVIPPNKQDSTLPNIYADIAAQINQYTDRPDLLLEVVEKHDPGFIKSLNDEARSFSKTYRLSRFRFGRAQSYVGLLVAVAAAAVLLFVLYLMATTGQMSFWNLVGLGVLYAITQSGMTGFMKVVGQITSLIKGIPGKG